MNAVFPAYLLVVLTLTWAFCKRDGRPERETPYGIVPLVVGVVLIGMGLIIGLGPPTALYIIGTIIFVAVGVVLAATGVMTLLINALPAPPWHRR